MAPYNPNQLLASFPDSSNGAVPNASTTLWSALPVNKYENNARNRYTPVIIKKNPAASLKRGSFRKVKLNFDLDDLLFLSLSGFLNVFDLYVFCAMR